MRRSRSFCWAFRDWRGDSQGPVDARDGRAAGGGGSNVVNDDFLHDWSSYVIVLGVRDSSAAKWPNFLLHWASRRALRTVDHDAHYTKPFSAFYFNLRHRWYHRRKHGVYDHFFSRSDCSRKGHSWRVRRIRTLQAAWRCRKPVDRVGQARIIFFCLFPCIDAALLLRLYVHAQLHMHLQRARIIPIQMASFSLQMSRMCTPGE
mmetsp:Transcript_16281/g.30896  ORF Transcript_16281/g.30896 Transcript_16281/m.30896 type:complete len:204 (-) Transcript_16281:37-648(-)